MKIKNSTLIIVAVLAFACLLLANPLQQPKNDKSFKQRADLVRKGATTTVIANDARPLHQAINALCEEYGWTVDFEDPPYVADSELVDSASPRWVDNNPNGKHIKIPAGGAFQADYDDGPNLHGPEGELRVLRNIVAKYNQSGNPGKFEVRAEGDQRFSIVGVGAKNRGNKDQDVAPILDTQISIPSQQRTAYETVILITKELSAKSGTEVGLMMVPATTLRQAKVTVGGQPASARSYLLDVFKGVGRPLVWNLLYEPTLPTYALNIDVVRQVQIDTYGRRRMNPIDAPK